MNLKKALSGSIVATFLLLSASSALAYSSPNDTITTPQTIDGTYSTTVPYKPTPKEPPVVTPMATSTPIDNEPLTSGNGTKSVYFDTNSTYPWYRIYVRNDSNVSYNVVIYSENHIQQGSFVVNGKSSNVMRNSSQANGRRYISITSSDGSIMKGIVQVRIAEFASEIAN